MKSVRFKIASGISIMVMLSAIVFPVVAHADPAFSGFGAGTQDSPYLITDCYQLEQIGLDTTANYEVVRDIDCSGVLFDTISDDFSGTLDGMSHRITGINLDGSGLFSTINGGTVSNLFMSGGIVDNGSTYTAASFAGFARGASTLSNVHSSLNISAGAEVGGLIGKVITGPTTIDKSSYTGTLASSGGYIGGLIGAIIGGSTVNITDSYHNGNIEAAAFVGGLVGSAGTNSVLNINHSYSAGTMTYQGHFDQGGLVGVLDSNGTISNSFAANTISGTAVAHGGAVVGDYTNGTFDNVWYDATSANMIDPSGNGTISSGVGGDTDVGYFKPPPSDPNAESSLFADWDFTDQTGVWLANQDEYPTLQNETQGLPPGGTDTNGDDIGDSYQPNVATLPRDDNLVATISVPLDSGCLLDTFSGPYPSWLDNSYFTDPDTNYSYATPEKVTFKMLCPTPGQTVPVTITYDKAYDTSHWVLRHYDTTTHVSTSIAGATFSTVSVNGTPHTTATYDLTDNGSLDSDPTDGVIVDPVSPAVYTGTIPAKFQGIQVPNTGFGQ